MRLLLPIAHWILLATHLIATVVHYCFFFIIFTSFIFFGGDLSLEGGGGSILT